MTPFHFQSHVAPDARVVTVPAGLEDKAALFALLQREVPLPDYFGKNWDALEECLSDLGWMKEPKLVLVHRDSPFATKPADQTIYLQILATAAKNCSRLAVIFPEAFRAEVLRLLAGKK